MKIETADHTTRLFHAHPEESRIIYQAIEGHPTMVVRDITKEEFEDRMRNAMAVRVVKSMTFSFSHKEGVKVIQDSLNLSSI